MFKSKFFHFAFAVFLTFALSVLASADTIRLKGGGIIKGKIVGFSGGKFTVVINDNTRQRQMTFTADEVESIVFDTDAAPTGIVKVPDTTDKNSTIITVGQNNKPDNSQVSPPRQDPAPNTTQPVNPPTDSSTDSNNSNVSAKPVTINVKVLADNTSNGWTNSGFVVQKGQRIKITASGTVNLGSGRLSKAGGIASLADDKKLIKDKPTGGLIAVVGDDNNDFIFVGESREFVAARDGALFLGVNEGNLDDNSGSFDAKIEIYPQ